MSFTNRTLNYNLPQYVAGDKPSYLVDFNGAMSAIDAGMHNNAQDISNLKNDTSTLTENLSTESQKITQMQTWQTNMGPILIDSAKGLVQIGNVNRDITLATNTAGTYEFSTNIQFSDDFTSIYGILARMSILVEIRTHSLGALYTQNYYILIPGQNVGLEYQNFSGQSIYTGPAPYYSINTAAGYNVITPIVGVLTSTLSSAKDITLGFTSRAVVIKPSSAPALANGPINALNVNTTIHVGRVLAFL